MKRRRTGMAYADWLRQVMKVLPFDIDAKGVMTVYLVQDDGTRRVWMRDDVSADLPFLFKARAQEDREVAHVN